MTSVDADSRTSHWLTRFVILRLLGLVYAAAFLSAARQLAPLIGSEGLLPVGTFLERAAGYFGSRTQGFLHLPSLFWFAHSNAALSVAAWTGFVLSLVVAAGLANMPLMAALWVLYMSIVHAGQDWYGYGWEIQLLETGFLGIFLSPALDPRPFPRTAPPKPVIWLFRWLIFRIMLGAGLIKLRGDPAWRNLTALYYHFETQPIPNPLSRWFHFLPRPVLRAGVVFNHLAEVAAPWLAFWPRTARLIAGGAMIAFQLALIAGGNLSFLNWLTIVPALACFDDALWARILPRRLVLRARAASASAAPVRWPAVVGGLVAALVGVLSIQPVVNLLSARQIMNTAFDPLDLVNTYGAFGSIGRERLNVVFEGTDAAIPWEGADWKPYPYFALPVDPDKRPVQVAPYQPRLDWQMWFAAMSTPDQYPWTVRLVWKLLHNDPGALSLFGGNPFPGHPPHYIRAVLFRYRFARPGTSRGRWWEREVIGTWLPPLSADDPQLIRFLRAYGWLPDAGDRKVGS